MRQSNTKQTILTEAVKLFAKKGYAAVTVEMIAAAVGIKAPSLYKHFKSKQEIFQSVLREMERRDAENAAGFSLPSESVETAPQTYADVSVPAFMEYCKWQFRYWTEDPFASEFRKMLTVEQYENAEMNALYHQYLGAGPLQYTADLLHSSSRALALYGPMHLLYGVYDRAADKPAVFALLQTHLAQWYALFYEEKGE